MMASVSAIVSIMLFTNVAMGTRFDTARSDELGSDTQPSQIKFPYDSIRLPGNVIPIKYQLYLHPNITNGKFQFTGHVKVLIDVKQETDSIILHSKSLTHFYTGVYEHKDGLNLEATNGKEVKVKGTLTHKKHEMVMVQLEEKLCTLKRYVLHIIFSGTLSTALRGFYRSSYTTKNGDKRYLATTDFEPTGARMAFPCFDEPAMKAHFSIIMVREKKFTGLSNMPVEKQVYRPDGLVEDHFQESVKMSTYLVAFIVSDFAHVETATRRGVKIRVWAPSDMISQAQYAIQVAPVILEYYEKLFKINFPLPKQDLIAIPDYAQGAMENWGLITYRLTALLYDEKESSVSNKQRVAVVIAHELAHQWFGDLVTMKWWNDLWLNEGFAAFVEYIGSDHVDKSWRMMDQFVNQNVQKAMALDSKLSSHPISVSVSDPADIGGLFDVISYQKGSSVIRMMRDFIGTQRFHNGLANYLNKYKYGNAASNDLWTCLSQATGNSVDVKPVMDTWTLQMGYPVINVVRDPNDKDTAIITQERFLTDVKDDSEEKPSPFNYRWEVPLTFYFERNRQVQRKWFHHKKESVKISWNHKAGWMKINADQIGFYRVNYDEENWKALAAQLKDDHTKLSDADRSNLIDDAFELAKAGKISHIQALDLTEYLKNEKQYVPFYSAMSSLGYIGGLLLHRPGYAAYEKYLLRQVLPLVHELGWGDKGSHLNKLLRSVVLRSAVHHGDSDTVMVGKKMYNDWMVNHESIPANLRSAVYLAGIKYGGQNEWDYMFNKYNSSIYASEKSTLMFSLAESSDPKILERYLHMTLNSDLIRSQDTCSVINKIAQNPTGSDMARNFVVKNWSILYSRYSKMRGLGRLITTIWGERKTEADLAEAKRFLSTHKLGSGKLYAKRALASIRGNIKWLKQNEKSVVAWLNNKVYG